MMAWRWRVILINNLPGHDNEEVDITAYTSFQRSRYSPVAGAQDRPSTLFISFVSTLSLDIRAGMEYWIGFRDDTTNEWDGTRAIYAGYIGELAEGADGSYHTFMATLDGYNFDLDTTDIEVWPDPAHVGVGAPDGISATEMLVGIAGGGTTYDGVLVQNLSGGDGIEYGVESAFDTITFSRSVLSGTGIMPGVGPGQYPAMGTWGYVGLRTALDDIANACNAVAETMDPYYYMEPAVSSADATKIRPRFCFVDGNDTSGPLVATFSTQPLAGEYQIYNPNKTAYHTRNKRGARDRVTFMGGGTDPTGPTTPGNITVATAYNSSRNINRTRYQTRPGRAVVYQDDAIPNKALAALLAAAGEAINYDAEGNLLIPVRHYVPPGSVVAIKIPQWGQTGTRYRVREVHDMRTPGVEAWELVIGSKPQNAQTVLQRKAQLAIARDQVRRIFSKVPNAATLRPTVQTPNHPQHNIQQAQSPMTARTTKPGYVPPGDDYPDDYIKRETHKDAANADREWVHDATGTGHPHHYGGVITALSTIPDMSAPSDTGLARIQIADDGVRLVRITISQDDGTDGYSGGVFYLYHNNVPVSWLDGVTPIPTVRGSVWKVACVSVGTEVSLPLTVILSEAA